MANAERLHQLAPEQYGSRKGFSAIEHGLNKRLTFDLIRQLCSPAALCSNDAKSCYDRIVHSVATLSMRRLGIPEAPIVSMFQTIQNMQHFVRTSYGDSAASFGGTKWTVPIHGVGQGNGAGPAIWAAVSTPVLNMMRDEGYGTFFTTAITAEDIQFVGYAFVDDTDLCETARNFEETAVSVATRMQQALNCWEGGIRATGGAIVPAKSHWYLLDFQWRDGRWSYAPISATPAVLYVNDAEGQTGMIDRLPVTEARRTLGVRLAPDGNNQAEFEYLRGQSLQWRDHVRAGHLPRHLAWQALTISLLPKLKYPLPATTFSRKACHKILSPALQAGLSASGVVRSFPRVLVHAPLAARGLNLPDLYLEQGISFIEMLLNHGFRRDDITGKLLRGTLQQMKVELGLPGPLLQQDYSKYHWLATDTWIKHAWLFLWEHDMSVEEEGPHLQCSREGDCFLIPTFHAAGFRGKQLQQLNRCRLFLQVTTLADICIGSGRSIAASAWNGTCDDSRPHYYRWPEQTRPPRSDWVVWQRALALIFTNSSPQRLLQTPLGSWTGHDTSWYWFYSESDERLYRRKLDQWYFHPRLPGRASRAGTHRFSSQEYSTPNTSLPQDLARATIDVSHSAILCTGAFHELEVPTTLTIPQKFGAFLTSQGDDVTWALGTSLPLDGASLAAAIASGTCMGVSDGSFKENFGTAAWILVDPQHEDFRISGECVVPGDPRDQCSFRSEVAGLFSLCQMVRLLCEFYEVDEGQVTIACDGTEALYRVFAEDFEPTPRDNHFDLLVAARAAIRKTSITWLSRWVKGHQDDDPTYELDEWAKLNIEMDLRAKAHWENSYGRGGPVQYSIQGEPWVLRLGRQKVCRDLREQVLDHVNGSAAREWWLNAKGLSKQVGEKIDWDISALALKQSKRSRRHWVVKHSAGFCAVGHMMVRWKEWPNAACPRCTALDETASHVWTCSGGGADDIWITAIANLRDWMISQDTAPELCEAVCTHLQAWRAGRQTPRARFNFLGLDGAIDRQETIGWQLFFEGFLAKEWVETQQAYYRWVGSRKTGKRWAVAIVKKLWDIAWDLWEHRNGYVHQAAPTNKTSQKLEQAVRQEFIAGSAWLAVSDQHLFRQTLEQLLASPLPVQQAWVDLVRTARQRASRRSATAYGGERRLLQAWLNQVQGNMALADSRAGD